MNPNQFKQFLKEKSSKLSSRTDDEKINLFIKWCQKKEIEELILRLASEEKGGWGKNYTLDFTTQRIIIKKKSFFKKFADLGYTAGLAPYPYLLLDKKKKPSDIKVKTTIDSSYLSKNDSNFYIMYEDIDELILRRGIDNIVTNMMGRAIVANYIKIKSKNDTFDFKLPVNKNGNFEDILRWITITIPCKILIE